MIDDIYSERKGDDSGAEAYLKVTLMISPENSLFIELAYCIVSYQYNILITH